MIMGRIMIMRTITIMMMMIIEVVRPKGYWGVRVARGASARPPALWAPAAGRSFVTQCRAPSNYPPDRPPSGRR